MKQKFYSHLITLGLLLFPLLMFGQRTITGTVSDAETGEPLIGVSILIVGTTSGALTDFDGQYSLNLPEGASTLEFSYTGFTSKTIEVGNTDVIDVRLSSGIDFEEVVVIGYGTVKKDDKTGSVNVVDSKDFNNGALTSPEQLVVGKVAGVQISTNDGAPGAGASIRIRGSSSINGGNEPLYVIDGVPLTNEGNPGSRNPLNFLNPNDIESFSILKDASATAIYGSRGANGVIIITTKKGKAGSAPQADYSGYVTFNFLNKDLSNFNAEQFRNVVTFREPGRLDDLGESNTDWFDELTENSVGHSHALSITGGGQNLGYRASVQYQKLEGVILPSTNENISVGLNINQALLDDNLKLNINYKGGFTRDNFGPGQIGSAWAFDPTQPVFDADNTDFGGYFEYGISLAPRNPVSAYQQTTSRGRSYRNLGNIEATYDFSDLVPGISAKVNAGFDANNGGFRGFQPTTFLNTQVSDRNGQVFIEDFTRVSKLLDVHFMYDRVIGDKHSINATAGYSYQDFAGEFPRLIAFNLATNNFGINNLAPADDFEAGNSTFENRLISFMARGIYSYDNRYILTATIRRDGSTRFGPENRWGWFPSAAVAWKILNEDFASGLTDIFSTLKMRVGFGIVGNQEIGDFNYLSQYVLSDAMAQYQFGDEFVTTARPNAYDASLKWEETRSINVGLDFGFLQGRINGSIEYFNELTTDLLFSAPVPAGTNLSDRVLTNIGSLANSGLELSLDAFAINTTDFDWNISGNISYLQNEVRAVNTLAGGGVPTGGIQGGVGNTIQILQVGEAINSFFVFEHILDAQGNPLADGIDHNEDGFTDLADIYRDLNNDGMVNDMDKKTFGKPAPDVLLGLTSRMTYKNFDLNFTLRGSLGNEVYNNNSSLRGNYDYLTLNPVYLNNLHTSVLLTNFEGPQFFSDYYVEDGSFVRLENITLGYNIPNIGDYRARIYATATNLFTLTNYSGVDPEVGGGIDNTPFPRTIGLLFGVNLGL